MKFRRLGRTGFEISEVSLGGVAFCWLEEKDCGALIDAALEQGVNFLDVYMGTGSRIRTHLSRHRDRIWLSTRGNADALNKCLKEFSLDRIDIFQITMVDSPEQYDDARRETEKLEKAREAGTIGFFGVGTHNPDFYPRIARDGVFDTILFSFNFIDESFLQSDFFEQAKANDVGLLVMKPLAGGNIRRATPALKYVLRHPVSSAVVGMASPGEVLEDTAVPNAPGELTAEEEAYIRKTRGELGDSFCRLCGHCIWPDPCPEGIQVRSMMMLKTFALQVRRQSVSDEELAKVETCTRCGTCVERCPYGLAIPDLLPQKVAEYRRILAAPGIRGERCDLE